MSDPRPADPRDNLRESFRRSISADSLARIRPKPEARPVAGQAATPPPAALGKADSLAIKGELHERLLKEIGDRNLLHLGEKAVAEAARDFVTRILETEDVALNEAERQQLVDELQQEATGVGPLTPLMADPAVSDILVNRFDDVYVEKYGRLERSAVRFRDNDHLVRVIERIAARIGRRIDVSSPLLDARLADGSRVNATLPPASIDGPTLSIRRFGRTRIRRDDIVRLGSISAEMTTFLDYAVKARKNIIISGGTGAGKSTLLGALAEAIPDGERIVTIEDPAELILDQRHVVRFETRPANIEGRGRLATRDLLINSLRMRPDRIIVGEVRGAEALDMLQAMNTGHDGSMSTVHANSTRDALARIETMVLMAGIELPSRAIREQIVSAVELLVHVRRYEDGVRRVDAIAEITGLEGTTPLMQEIFKFQRRGRTKEGRVEGTFVPTGVVPRLVEQLKAQDIQIPMTIFRKPEAGLRG